MRRAHRPGCSGHKSDAPLKPAATPTDPLSRRGGKQSVQQPARLRYVDPGRAIQWMITVLGARGAVRLTLPGGRTGHAELTVDDVVISVGLAAAPAAPTNTSTGSPCGAGF